MIDSTGEIIVIAECWYDLELHREVDENTVPERTERHYAATAQGRTRGRGLFQEHGLYQWYNKSESANDNVGMKLFHEDPLVQDIQASTVHSVDTTRMKSTVLKSL